MTAILILLAAITLFTAGMLVGAVMASSAFEDEARGR